ncbi:nicotinate-nucleotide adenylyltransferase [Salinimicrobium sediminis]|uniref:Probable nicotinate-nucleotide adenylyltransferase n=1 Tax=Salinimicrobium sediminis TaxID=1343891 RepID=A0A285X1I6_9FLAO|nr:nicotinate (nicotinamide) nucleotide adenylyltransferase [Salinimicrobium sediminis]SOC79182.1 nicotinate-nucleotide adenylyltransferase [Salinimicrobium sediminis]
MKKRVGLFFGTFNPVHIGHLILANHLLQYSDLTEIWMVVTPHNPFKKKSSLLNNQYRYDMVWQLCEEYPGIRPSDIEFNLPQPNYTVTTLAHLEDKYPQYDFSLIMGEDNLKSFPKWKNYEVILERHHIIVYPRHSEGETHPDLLDHPKVSLVDAPRVEISSTFIRKAIKAGKDVRPLLPPMVWKYIDEMNFYR